MSDAGQVKPRHDAVAHALAYPFNPPHTPYLFAKGGRQPFTDAALAMIAQADRTPVLAVGSNGSAQRLSEKFGDDAQIPVTMGDVADHVVCHSAMFSRYGAIPATLHPWSGARSQTLITWLTASQLTMMDATEDLGVAYDRVLVSARLTGAALSMVAAAATAVDGACDAKLVDCYVARAGALGDENGPVVSTAARVSGADGLTAMTQDQAQRHAMGVLADTGPLDAFVLANVRDSALRTERSKNISNAVGLPFPVRSA